MKTINLNFVPKTKVKVHGVDVEVPHIIDYNASLFIGEIISQRVSVADPSLEYRVAQALLTEGEVELTQDEFDYIKSIIVSLPLDNEMKGQILERFAE